MAPLNLSLPEEKTQDRVISRPRITVFGVGGAGCNAVNNMIMYNLEGANFVVANTDAQCLEHAKADIRIQLGETVTKGLGAGASPEIGKSAAEENIDAIKAQLADSNMVFITAGMGGGTGTGASPIIAKAAKDAGILTVGVVTKPFHFEGNKRMEIANKGLEELKNVVDTLIVIPNQNLFRIANEKTTFANAFETADNILKDAVQSITVLMVKPGLINLDFADVRSVMKEMGKAMMGSGEAEGENRAVVAAEAAISNPLLDINTMKGARGLLINITGGSDMTLFEVDEAANRIREEVDDAANIIFGSAYNESLEGKIRVSVVATGIEQEQLTSFGDNALHKNDSDVTDDKTQSDYVANYPLNNSNYNNLARKNIPESYPSEAENAQNLSTNSTNDAKNNNMEDDFVPKKPVEPELKTVNNTSSTNIHAKKPNVKMSLFSRMVNSVGFMSNKPVQEDTILTSNEKILSDDNLEDVNIDDDHLVDDDVLDVPAFERRNKRS